MFGKSVVESVLSIFILAILKCPHLELPTHFVVLEIADYNLYLAMVGVICAENGVLTVKSEEVAL